MFDFSHTNGGYNTNNDKYGTTTSNNAYNNYNTGSNNKGGYGYPYGYEYYSGDYDYYDDTTRQSSSFDAKLGKFVNYVSRGKC